jgi:hypothetical protein
MLSPTYIVSTFATVFSEAGLHAVMQVKSGNINLKGRSDMESPHFDGI